MSTMQADSLMTIATNSKMRVYDRIQKILGEDKRVSSIEEANAILAIPGREITLFEDKLKLPLTQKQALHYLEYGDRNLRDDFADAYKYLKEKGSELYKRLSDYFQNNKKTIASRSK